MDRFVKRCSLGAGGILAIAAFVSEARPRVMAWNEASNANTIALQRAGSCVQLTFVKANIIPLDTKGTPLEPGTLVCDRYGRTGKINGKRAIDYFRQGDAMQIREILKEREGK